MSTADWVVSHAVKLAVLILQLLLALTQLAIVEALKKRRQMRIIAALVCIFALVTASLVGWQWELDLTLLMLSMCSVCSLYLFMAVIWCEIVSRSTNLQREFPRSNKIEMQTQGTALIMLVGASSATYATGARWPVGIAWLMTSVVFVAEGVAKARLLKYFFSFTFRGRSLPFNWIIGGNARDGTDLSLVETTRAAQMIDIQWANEHILREFMQSGADRRMEERIAQSRYLRRTRAMRWELFNILFFLPIMLPMTGYAATWFFASGGDARFADISGDDYDPALDFIYLTLLLAVLKVQTSHFALKSCPPPSEDVYNIFRLGPGARHRHVAARFAAIERVVSRDIAWWGEIGGSWSSMLEVAILGCEVDSDEFKRICDPEDTHHYRGLIREL
uniref:Uncharacterized protein n=1 Tax=Lotharella oceanica TaxID=641309 RepID=A0A7S2U3I0_9EUKA|mmetsp:Transcript_8/g.13  ORF Transcript_8/g.13 Transcript_8/m.13 type:complete len:391 (+) Transcript_8:68-1240(+)